MEPTIYKPSIYKGPTIYKTGDNGGGVVYDFSKYKISCKGDIDIEGFNFKSLAYSYYISTTDEIDLDSKNFEIQIRCKITGYHTNRVPILGFIGGANNLSTSLQYYVDDKQLWSAVPNSNNSGWQSSGWVNCIDCYDNEFHTYKIKYDKNLQKVTTILDNVLVSEFVCNETPKQQKTHYCFGRNYASTLDAALDVDMENTYIKDSDTNEIVFGLIK